MEDPDDLFSNNNIYIRFDFFVVPKKQRTANNQR